MHLLFLCSLSLPFCVHILVATVQAPSVISPPFVSPSWEVSRCSSLGFYSRCFTVFALLLDCPWLSGGCCPLDFAVCFAYASSLTILPDRFHSMRLVSELASSRLAKINSFVDTSSLVSSLALTCYVPPHLASRIEIMNVSTLCTSCHFAASQPLLSPWFSVACRCWLHVLLLIPTIHMPNTYF